MNRIFTLAHVLRRHWLVWSCPVMVVSLLSGWAAQAQTGNFVPSGAETTNFGTVSLATSTSWVTARTATPGYFAAVGGATYTNASDASNVNGYIKHYANAANQGFSFPVGSGTDSRNLTVSGTRTASSVIGVAWIVGDPTTTTDPTGPSAGTHPITSVGTDITAVSPAGMWDWQDLTNDAAGLTVTVSIPDLSSFGPAANLRLVGWNGTQWVNLSGNTGASGNAENSTLSGTMVSGISALGVGFALTCPNPSVGGSLTLVGTLPLCSASNQGALVLSGQTGSVVKWQTSTNGGLNWTDLASTAGLTQYSFANAQNNQQYRAVVNAGGSCSDAFSSVITTTTSSSACSVNCDVKPGGLSK